MRLLIVGAPGAGKGSQAALLSQRLGIPAVSTGDLFRAHVRNRTPLGLRVEEILSAGDYVPDSVTNDMVRERLGEPDTSEGFILDGYPRTPQQVEELDTIVPAGVDAVIHLVVHADELIPRLTRRGSAEGRADDNPESIRHRLAVYESVTAPILAIYRERGLVLAIDGLGTQDEVSERILEALAVAR